MPSHADDDSGSRSFTMPDGRKIGFEYYGAESGPTVFYLHEFPGSRLSGVFFDSPAKTQGSRTIAVERPGVSVSSPQPGRRLLDHGNDVRELAKSPRVETYGVIGFSTGRLYALACAYSLQEENLKGISIIGRVGSMDMATLDQPALVQLPDKPPGYGPSTPQRPVSLLRTFRTDRLWVWLPGHRRSQTRSRGSAPLVHLPPQPRSTRTPPTPTSGGGTR